MNRSSLGQVASVVGKVFLWIGGGIGLFILFSALLMLAWLAFILIKSGQSEIPVPQVQINPKPLSRYLITVRPIGNTKFHPTSAQVEVTHSIRLGQSRRSCVPDSLETGTDYPDYPVKELPAINVLPQGDVTFIATYDYIKRENYYGKGPCPYGISAATLTVRDDHEAVRIPLSWRVFDDFSNGERTSFLFCIWGKDFAVPSSQGMCRSHLDNLPEEAELSFQPDFIVEAKKI